MGMFPRQEFIFGIGFDEEVSLDFDQVGEWCEKNGLGYVMGGDYADSWNSGLVVGIKMPNYLYSCPCTPRGKYLGGYHVAEFDFLKFKEWIDSAALTDEQVKMIQEYLHTNALPKLYTVSTRQ